MRTGASGFTLIELMVVLALLGTFLSFTLPKFRSLVTVDESKKELNMIINTVRDLKKRAVADGVDYVLHLDSSKDAIWITSENMSSETMERSRDQARALSDSTLLIDVDVYGSPSVKDESDFRIRFSRKGYCDMAYIHLKTGAERDEITIVVDPFLKEADVRSGHLMMDRCS